MTKLGDVFNDPDSIGMRRTGEAVPGRWEEHPLFAMLRIECSSCGALCGAHLSWCWLYPAWSESPHGRRWKELNSRA